MPSFTCAGISEHPGEQSRKRKGNVFGSGSRAPIAISLLIKNPNIGGVAQIYFRHRQRLLESRRETEKAPVILVSVAGVDSAAHWKSVEPDAAHGDWLETTRWWLPQFIAIGDKSHYIN